MTHRSFQKFSCVFADSKSITMRLNRDFMIPLTGPVVSKRTTFSVVLRVLTDS